MVTLFICTWTVQVLLIQFLLSSPGTDLTWDNSGNIGRLNENRKYRVDTEVVVMLLMAKVFVNYSANVTHFSQFF